LSDVDFVVGVVFVTGGVVVGDFDEPDLLDADADAAGAALCTAVGAAIVCVFAGIVGGAVTADAGGVMD
jgi:hypothetical protein